MLLAPPGLRDRIDRFSARRPVNRSLTIPAHHGGEPDEADHSAIGRSAADTALPVRAREDRLMTFLCLMLGVFVAIAVWPNRQQGRKLVRYNWDQAN